MESLFHARVIGEESFDPFFKIEFSYQTDSVEIKRGYVEVVRNLPKPMITYDEKTESKIGSVDKAKLELEILNVTIAYLLNQGVRRSSRGSFILRTA